MIGAVAKKVLSMISMSRGALPPDEKVKVAIAVFDGFSGRVNAVTVPSSL
jgi:hypothetical protein